MKMFDPGDLVWIPAGTHLVSVEKNSYHASLKPSVGIFIEEEKTYTWKNWMKVLWSGEGYLVNKDKIKKIDNDSELRRVYASKISKDKI